MAKMVLTVEDGDEEEGQIEANVEFDPPVGKDDPLTPAQSIGVQCLEYIGAKPKRRVELRGET